MTGYDVIVAGAGPAGSVCAAMLAKAGCRVLLLDRARFPRDKVCGDCLNPSVWPILDRLGLRERILDLPHARIESIAFCAIDGTCARVAAPDGEHPELTIKRRDLDALLVAHAQELNAEFRDGVAVARVSGRWVVETDGGKFSAPILVAADGRNSIVAREAKRIRSVTRERVAIQCHCPRPRDHGREVRMLFRHDGYGGTALVNDAEINLCLVSTPGRVESVRAAAMREFEVPRGVEWRTIAPLSRAPARDVARDGLFLVGDAARVVEPFTGEGIYYAMRSGELAAASILESDAAGYRSSHAEMYRGRLWINRLARLAVQHPRATSALIRSARHFPFPLERLTKKVLRPPQT